MEMVAREKRTAESDLEMLKDKVKVILKEKLELENNMNMIQKHELTRLNELEQKFSEVSEQYIKAKEELANLRVTEINLNEQLSSANKGRQNFKEQYLEMREVNKDLKLHFSKLQQRIDELENRDRDHGYHFQ